MNYIPRAIEPILEATLAAMPAVFLNGPRQAGKSTLVRHLARSRFPADYVTFDDMTAFAAASADPEGFLRGFGGPVILDEVQRVPGCFRVLKKLIDEQRADSGSEAARGRFLLTGSANIMAFPELAEALVGRMGVLSLLPFSANETVGHGVPVIRGWFDQAVGGGRADSGKDLATVIRRATFPEISGAIPATAAIWLDGYIGTLLQRDIRQLADIEKMSALPDLVKLLAARAGGLLNDAGCARDARLNPMTFRRYRTLIDQLFLTMRVPPWHRNIGKRPVKSPKLYFTDTLLLCHQLGVDIESLSGRNPGLYGHVVENFVASELARQLALTPECRLFHFRTHDDKEVDFVIERRDGRLLGIEVKARAHAETRDFDGLRLLQEKAGKDFARGILLHTGTATIPFGDNMFAMPVSELWQSAARP